MSAYWLAKRSAIAGVMNGRGMLDRWIGSRLKAASAIFWMYFSGGIS
jgi:hypothetical protein